MIARYLLLIICCWAADVYAAESGIPLYIAAAAGTGSVNGNDYDRSTTGYTRIGINFQLMSLSAGYVDFGRFTDRRTAATDFTGRAYTLAVNKLLAFDKRVGLNVTLGLCVWRTESTFLGNNLGDDNGTGSFFGLAPRLRFNPHTAVFLGMERYFDINGNDITSTDVGVVLNF